MAEINVAAGSFEGYSGSYGTGEMRIYASYPFTPSDGDPVPSGRVRSLNFCKTVPWTSSGGQINYSSFTLDSHPDAIEDANVSSYTIALFGNDGAFLGVVYRNLRVDSAPSNQTLAQIIAYTDTNPVELPDTYYNAEQVDNLLSTLLSAFTFATPGTIGDLITIIITTLTQLGATFTDGTAPTVPTGLARTVLGETSIQWDWDASTDDTGVTGYEISIDGGAAIDVGNVLTATRTGLSPGTTYALRVRAYDAAGNRSAYCTAVNGTTSDLSAPSIPVMTAPTGVGESSITFNWNASTDNVAVTGYDLQIATDSGFTSIVSTHNLANVLTYNKTGLNPSTQYYARVRAHDAVPNNSAYSTSTNATTTADATAPTVPTMQAASDITDTEIRWNWTAATDNVAVTGYDLQVAEDAAFTVNLATHNLGNVLTLLDTGLNDATQYYARVRAHDAIPNNSAYSSSVNATTNVGPFDPSIVAGLMLNLDASQTTPVANGASLTTWEDQGPNNYDASEVSGVKPTYHTGVLNGLPVIRFNGTDQKFTACNYPTNTKPFTLFAVVKPTDAGGGYHTIVGSLGSGGVQWRLDSVTGFQNVDVDGTAAIGTDNVAQADATWVLLCVTYSGTGELKFYTDGVLGNTVTNNQSFTADTAVIGGKGAQVWLGDMAHIVAFDSVLSGPDRITIETGLMTQWGL